MAVYNEKPVYLEAAVKSILRQTETDFEFIIVDDGTSQQPCLELLKRLARSDPRVSLLRNPTNIGLTKTLNKALDAAGGKYVARMDSDDIALPQRLKTQLQFMQKNPDCVLCGSWVDIIDKEGCIIGKKEFFSDYRQIRRYILRFNFFTHSTWFFKKDVIKKFGGYSLDAPLNEDYDLLLRLVPHNRVENIPECLLKYRVNPNSISHKNNKLQERNSLSTRMRAIQSYGFKKREYLNLILPWLVYLFLPTSIKQRLMRFYEFSC